MKKDAAYRKMSNILHMSVDFVREQTEENVKERTEGCRLFSYKISSGSALYL